MLELNLPIMLLHYLAKLNVQLYNFLSCGLVRWIAIVSVWEIYFIRLDIFLRAPDVIMTYNCDILLNVWHSIRQLTMVASTDLWTARLQACV